VTGLLRLGLIGPWYWPSKRSRVLEPLAAADPPFSLRRVAGAPGGLLSYFVRVRHEVAGGIVTLGCHQLFCQLSPIGTCVAGNSGVRSSRDNVSSLSGVVVNARADTTTASLKAVGDQEGVAWSTQVKRR